MPPLREACTPASSEINPHKSRAQSRFRVYIHVVWLDFCLMIAMCKRLHIDHAGVSSANVRIPFCGGCMRTLKLTIALCFLSSLALAQVNIAGGTAGNWGPSYGVVVVPYVPLITTPSVSLSTYAPSPAGASSTAFGAVAGATNSTLSLPVTSSSGTYTTPEWYGASSTSESGEAPREHHAERGGK